VPAALDTRIMSERAVRGTIGPRKPSTIDCLTRILATIVPIAELATNAMAIADTTGTPSSSDASDIRPPNLHARTLASKLADGPPSTQSVDIPSAGSCSGVSWLVVQGSCAHSGLGFIGN
jgi:hypothetical protein